MNPYEAPLVSSPYLGRQNRPGPVYSILSVAFAPLSLFVLFLLQVTIDGLSDSPRELKQVVLPIWLICAVTLYLASIAAAVMRRERHRWLTIVSVVITVWIAAWIMANA
jgi:hypothetical protein